MRAAALLCLAIMLGTGAEAAEETSPVGKWRTFSDLTGRESGIVEIERNGDTLQGKVVRLIPQPGDPLNPVCRKCDGPEKDHPILGLMILKGFRKDGDEWDGGTILDPRSGSLYSCELRLDDSGRKLLVHGYIGISLIGRTQTWIRAD